MSHLYFILYVYSINDVVLGSRCQTQQGYLCERNDIAVDRKQTQNACAEWCLAYPGCEGWTYEPSRRMCYLARSTSCNRPSRWFIWGSRQCGEGIIHENLEEFFIHPVNLDPECRCGVEYKPNGNQISQHIFRGSEIDRVSQKNRNIKKEICTPTSQ